MKYTIALAIAAISFNAYAFQPENAAEAYKVWQHESNNGSDTVLRQNEQNDPSIHGRRTQTAYELGEVGQGATHDTVADEVTGLDTYPQELGQALEDEGYPQD